MAAIIGILIGITAGVFLLFDIDVPFIDEDDETRDLPTVTLPPTRSPVVSADPGTPPSTTTTPASPSAGPKTWQLFGNAVYGQNATDEFGTALALADQGNILVVGAPLDENGVGSIQTFAWDAESLDWDATWAPDILGHTPAGHFGDTLAVSASGDIVAACSFTQDQGSIVQIFQRITGGFSWVQVRDAIPRKGRGTCPLALSADGLTVAFGSKWYWPAGIVQVYKLDQQDEWNLYGQELSDETLQDLSMGDGWGESVALSSDGNVLAVTASGGSYVRVLALDTSTTQWVPKGQVLNVGNDPRASKLSARMSVSLSANGNIVAFGVPEVDGGKGSLSGLVQVYRFDETADEWSLLGQNLPGSQANEHFGFSLALSNDGLTLVASGVGNDAALGVVRIFQFDETLDEWEQVTDDIQGEAPGDEWGYAVSVSSDGNVVAAGGRFHGGAGEEQHTGQVRVYKFA